MDTISEKNEQPCTIADVSSLFNLIWDADVTVENDFRSYILGKPIYDMSCNKCLTFIGSYHKPEDCQDRFCHKCGQPLING